MARKRRVKRAGPKPLPRYLPAVVEAALPVAKPGTVTHVSVYHDDRCPALEGGPCGCNPEVGIPTTDPPRRER
jgi:hypothetical protein